MHYHNSTTARPDSRWLSEGTKAKMVDFCLSADLGNQHRPNVKVAQKLFCESLGGLSVNHTSFQPLQLRPIMLSIETKKPGTDPEKAQLQMTIWHSAQWAFLREAVSVARRLRRGSREEELGDGEARMAETGEEEDAAVRQILSRLPFLPGLLISGHRWSLVMSTWEDYSSSQQVDGGNDGSTRSNSQSQASNLRGADADHRVHFWKECQFGSTQTILETFEVVAGVREIAGWIVAWYLPWFKQHVLNLPSGADQHEPEPRKPVLVNG